MLIYGPSNYIGGAEVDGMFWTVRQRSRTSVRDLTPGYHDYEVK